MTLSYHGSAIYRPLPMGYHRILKTIVANGVKGEPKIEFLKFSSQMGIETLICQPIPSKYMKISNQHT